MKKGETYVGKVKELAFPNKGIASVDGVDVVIKNTLPGQEVSFILNKNKPGLKEGRLVEILQRSVTETEEGCSVCDKCGGCAYQTLPYEEELRLKDGMARTVLGKALKQHEGVFYEETDGQEKPDTGNPQFLLNRIYEGITGSPEDRGYRNKMEFSFGNEVKDGPITLGMHVSGHFMDVIDTPDCRIVDGDFRSIRAFVIKYAAERGLPFYHRYSNTGFLRNLLVRKGKNTGEILVDIVTTSDGELDEAAFVRGLCGIVLGGNLTGILHTVNDGVADVVKNEETFILYGRDFIYDELLGLKFRISAFSFFQTNTKGAELLYERVREYIRYAIEAFPSRNGSGTDEGEAAGVVYDLYSGTGTIAQIISGSASKVYGVEIVQEAVDAAKDNARLNGISNAEFICGDVLKVIDDLTDKPDLIILDPPRDGVNPKALKKILDYGVPNIVYISCKITSLARDLHPIIESGYRPVRLSVIDMFPRTTGMESIALLERVSNRKADAKVHIDVDLEDYYRIKDAQGKDGK